MVAAALAARTTDGRPVRLAVTRQQMFALTGYRTATISRVRLGADGRRPADGDRARRRWSRPRRSRSSPSRPPSPTRMMYAAPNRRTSHRLARLDVAVPSWMRAPGEMPGMFAHEVAMDELAVACGLDPVELRVRNEPDLDPETGKPFNDRRLVDCLRRGAERFGWADRPAEAAGDPRRRLVGRHRGRVGDVPGHEDAGQRRPGALARRRPLRRRDRRRRHRHRRAHGADPDRRRRPRRRARRRSTWPSPTPRCRRRPVAGGSSGTSSWGTRDRRRRAAVPRRPRRRRPTRAWRRRPRPPTTRHADELRPALLRRRLRRGAGAPVDRRGAGAAAATASTRSVASSTR